MNCNPTKAILILIAYLDGLMRLGAIAFLGAECSIPSTFTYGQSNQKQWKQVTQKCP